MNTKIAIAAALMLPYFSEAATWKEIGGNDEVLVLIDTESIRPTGKVVKSWLRWQWAKPQDVPNTFPVRQFQAEAQLQVSNCAAGTFAVAQGVRYEGSFAGAVVDSYTIPERSWQFSEAVPESIGETIVKFACRSVRRGSK